MLNETLKLVDENTKPITFIGTPCEIEAKIRKTFDLQRVFIVGYTSELDDDGELLKDGDGNFVPKPEQEEYMDLMERSVWRFTLTPASNEPAVSRCRTEMLSDVSRMDNERELYELLGKGELKKEAEDAS